MKKCMFLGLGALVCLVGCVDLSGANISNVGNGNTANVKTGDINAGNGNNVGPIGNGGGYSTPGPYASPFVSPGPYSGATYTGVRFNREAFRLRRLPADVNLANLQYDASGKTFVNNQYNPNPQPSVYRLDLGAPENCLIRAQAYYADGNNANNIYRDQYEWEWTLPSGIELVNVNTMGPYDGGVPMLLVAKGDISAGKYEIRLAMKSDRKIVATASVEVLDQGGADLIIE